MRQVRRSISRHRLLLTSQDGVALIMVLWALTILSVIVFSFSLMARTEVHSAASFRAVVANRFLAEAGIERGIMEIAYRNANRGQKVVLEGREVVKIDGTPYTGKIEKGQYTFRITDESGKISLNGLTESSGILLKNLMTNMGYRPEDADTVLDSVLDWRDPDDLHRLHGVESDYYMSLPNPYKARNSNFDTVEELLLVKGVTPAMLYGDGKQKGIINFLTVYTSTTSINRNAAPREVLLAIPGMTPEAADVVIAQRTATGIQSTQEVTGVPEAALPAASPYLSVTDSNIFAIEATGNSEGGPKGYGIRAIVTFEAGTGYRYLYYKSPAQVEP
jgi:general secretion pathway protein K